MKEEDKGRMAASFRGYLPSRLKPLLRPWYHSGFRIQLHVRCFLDDLIQHVQNRDQRMPPAMIRFRVGESIDINDFLQVGKGCADLVQKHLQAIGSAFAPGMRVLDFGCGCGRVLRWLTARAPFTQFFGADVDDQAIRWCTENLKPALFKISTPRPPLPYESQYFDVVYCISVFTHLDEQMQGLWLGELKRILKPNGSLIFTVHGTNAAGVLDARERQKLQREGFLFHTSQKLKGLLPTWYHTAWHTEDYIVGRASQWFSRVEYAVVPDSGQDVVRCRP